MARLKLTLGKIELLEKYVKFGAPKEDIFAASGVSRSTYYRWLSIGQAICEDDFEHPDILNRPTRKKGESKGKYNGRLHSYVKELTLYATLYEKMMKADANSRVEMVFVIRSAALANDWRAALELLEHRDPVNWHTPTILRARAAALAFIKSSSIAAPFCHFLKGTVGAATGTASRSSTGMRTVMARGKHDMSKATVGNAKSARRRKGIKARLIDLGVVLFAIGPVHFALYHNDIAGYRGFINNVDLSSIELPKTEVLPKKAILWPVQQALPSEF